MCIISLFCLFVYCSIVVVLLSLTLLLVFRGATFSFYTQPADGIKKFTRLSFPNKLKQLNLEVQRRKSHKQMVYFLDKKNEKDEIIIGVKRIKRESKVVTISPQHTKRRREIIPLPIMLSPL